MEEHTAVEVITDKKPRSPEVIALRLLKARAKKARKAAGIVRRANR